jgi:hypothetical protein
MPRLTPPCARVRQQQKRDVLLFPILLTGQIGALRLPPVGSCKGCNDNELKQSLRDALRSRGTEFYNSGIQRLTQRWQKCVEDVGNFVGKQPHN